MHDEGEAPAVGVSGSQGVQAGTGNVQNNMFVSKPSLDLGSLSALSLHAAVARLRAVPHNEVVDFFARVSSQDVAEVLKALRRVDDAKVVAVLADINPRKAAEIISLHAPDLAGLPIAAEAIEERAIGLQWRGHGDVGHLERDRQMYCRKYEKGAIYWSVEQGAHAIGRAFMECYTSADYGYPTTECEDAIQSFEKGIICWSKPNGPVFGVTGEIYLKWYSSPPGLPLTASESYKGGSRQRFTGGVIYSSKHGVFIVLPDIARVIEDEVPVADELRVTSSRETDGRAQRFQDSSGNEVIVCQSLYGTHRVSGPIAARYRELGELASWLGFPTSDEISADGEKDQLFERGWICYREGVRAVRIPTWAYPLRNIIFWIIE